jgi:hypothetical protein
MLKVILSHRMANPLADVSGGTSYGSGKRSIISKNPSLSRIATRETSVNPDLLAID